MSMRKKRQLTQSMISFGRALYQHHFGSIWSFDSGDCVNDSHICYRSYHRPKDECQLIQKSSLVSTFGCDHSNLINSFYRERISPVYTIYSCPREERIQQSSRHSFCSFTILRENASLYPLPETSVNHQEETLGAPQEISSRVI